MIAIQDYSILNNKSYLASLVPLPNNKCLVKNCEYFGSEDNITCSKHDGFNAYVLYKKIPKEIVKKIIEYIQEPQIGNKLMSDEDIIEKLRLNYNDVIYDDNEVNERIFWFENQNNFVLNIHCEDFNIAIYFLNLDENKKFSINQAERLYNVIKLKFNKHTCIAFEKAIFSKTFAPMNLDRDLFSVSYCYLGKDKIQIKERMTKQKIYDLIYL